MLIFQWKRFSTEKTEKVQRKQDRFSNANMKIFDQNTSGSASVVGPEEEREPLEFRTFLNHHDVVMMITIEDY